MRVLITGATGFVGTHLAKELQRTLPDAEITGLAWGPYDAEAFAAAAPGVRLVEGDLTKPGSIGPVLEQSRPDIIYHLAAASSVARSWQNAARSLEINAIGTARLFDTVLGLDFDPIVVVSSTAEIYGRVDGAAGPLPESTPAAPVSPYGTSKTAQDLLTGQYHDGLGLATVRLRFFHLTGPGRPAHFVASSFARQVARAELGLAPATLRLGNLESIRDFTDVRDAVRACRMAAERRLAGRVFHVCSGRPVPIADVADALVNLSRCPIEIQVDPERLRPTDIPWLVGDPTEIERAVGWRAEIPLKQTLADLLDWWRLQLATVR